MANEKRASTKLLAIGLILCAVGLVGGTAAIALYASGRASYSERIERAREEARGEGLSTTLLEGKTGVAADDGELHDTRTQCEGYSFEEGSWRKDESEHLDSYDMDMRCEFDIRYPQLTGDLEHLEAINELLRTTAMQTVHDYYESPSAQSVDLVKTVLDEANDGQQADTVGLLTSKVEYAVSYNDDNLLSVCFSDQYCVGSELLEFIRLRTVNVNLQTGETYQLDDVMEVDESIAESFVDNFVLTSGTDENEDGRMSDDECFAVSLVGRDALVQGLQGKGELTEGRLDSCLFIDGNGRPNLGVNFWLSSELGFTRGWWDVTITEGQLAGVRKDSSLWELLGV